MEYCSICDKPQGCFAEPLPEHHILIHGGRLQLGFRAQVKDLECAGLGFQRDDLLGPVHDGTVGLDRPPRNSIAILEVDDNDFRGCRAGFLFAYANERIGFEGLGRASA